MLNLILSALIILFAGGMGYSQELAANLAVGITDAHVYYLPGTQTTYTVEVTNLGDATANNVTVTTAVGSQITQVTWTAAYSSGSSGPVIGSGNINAQVTLAAGGKGTFTVVAVIGASATGTLTSTVTAMFAGETNTATDSNQDGGDNDGDGLTNYQEIITYGTNPNQKDSNGDGVEDGDAVSMGYSPTLNFSALIAHPPTGLYTANQMQAMAFGDLVLTKNANGSFTLNYDIEQSVDMVTWIPYQAFITPLTGLPVDKAFVRIKLKTQIPSSEVLLPSVAEPAVSAPFTPTYTALGRYQHKLYLAINSRWNMKVQQAMAQIGNNRVVIRFFVNPDGSISQLDFVQGDPNSVLGRISSDTINQSSNLIGPFTDALLEEMPDGFVWQLAFQLSVGVEESAFPLSVICDSEKGTYTKTPSLAYYTLGAGVTIQVAAKAGYLFTTWSGDSTASTTSITLTLDSDKSVTANFSQDNGDNDADGLSNFQESITFRTNPDVKDSNGDGVEDGQAVAMGYNPWLSFSALIAHPPTGLYTASQMEATAMGDLVLTKDVGGTFTLNYDIEQSTDLQSWLPYQSFNQQITNLPPDKAFIRIKAKQ